MRYNSRLSHKRRQIGNGKTFLKAHIDAHTDKLCALFGNSVDFTRCHKRRVAAVAAYNASAHNSRYPNRNNGNTDRCARYFVSMIAYARTGRDARVRKLNGCAEPFGRRCRKRINSDNAVG